MEYQKDENGLNWPTPETGPEFIDAFIEEIQTDKYKPVPTGINSIDKLLHGGFMRGSLVTIGAAPGAGKTAIAQYILENMAKNGNDVLYINLEMDRAQLLARSIARTAFNNKNRTNFKTELTALDVMKGYAWTKEQRDFVYYAASLYREQIAPHFIYNPEGVKNELEDIKNAIIKESERVMNQGRPAPIVCIDYLQLIQYEADERGRIPDTAEGIKRALKTFEELAEKLGTIIILILAHNRASNKEGITRADSGRDTSNIEYSGDLMLGLSFTAVEDRENVPKGKDKQGNTIYGPCKPEDIFDAMDAARDRGESTPLIARRLCLKVLKSRYTENGGKARFIFDGKHFTFEPDGVTYNNNYGVTIEDPEAHADALTRARSLPPT